MATILICCDFFVPGHKGGGPIVSISELATLLSGSHEVLVVTRNRDLGDDQPYVGIEEGQWVRHAGYEIMYLASEQRSFVSAVARILRARRPDIIYLNSFHSGKFSIVPQLVNQLSGPRAAVLLAPRGEFAPAALQQKPLAKWAYRWLYRMAGFSRRAAFHAAMTMEAEQIVQVFDRGVEIHVAPDLPRSPVHLIRSAPKTAGHARLVFLGRITPIKNLLWFIERLASTKVSIDLDVVGPREDKIYAHRCELAARDLPSNVRVRFLGEATPDVVVEQLADADALVLPSLGESYGHVVPEALGCGCAVIVSDRTPWNRVASAGCGWFLSLDDPKAWIEAVEELAALDDVAHQRFRTNARNLASALADDSAGRSANLVMFEALGRRFREGAASVDTGLGRR